MNPPAPAGGFLHEFLGEARPGMDIFRKFFKKFFFFGGHMLDNGVYNKLVA